MLRWLSPGTHNPVVGLAVVESVEPVKIAVNKRPNVVAIAQPVIGAWMPVSRVYMATGKERRW